MTHFHLRTAPRGSGREGCSDQWFDQNAPQGDLRFLIEAVDAESRITAGSIQVGLQIGMTVPRYWYYVGQVSYRSDEPMLARNDRVLLLGNDFTGAHELHGIRLLKPADQAILDALLIGTLAMIPPGADMVGHVTPVVLEIPGSGLAEHAPFWKGTGRHFYPRSFPKLTGEARREWESHLASLLPRQPLVVSLLEPEARAAIGSPAEDAVDLHDAAIRCRFRRSRQVRVCDGGPVLEAPAFPFQFEKGRIAGAASQLQHARRCVIRADDRRDAWLVQAERASNGIVIAADTSSIVDALRNRDWAFSFY